MGTWIRLGSAWVDGSGAPPTPPVPSTLRLGHWDESVVAEAEGIGWDPAAPVDDAVGGNHNLAANRGINRWMGRLRADGIAPTQIQKAYASSWQSSFAASQVQQASEFGNAFCLTQQMPGGDVTAVNAGTHDSAIEAWFESIPAGMYAATMLVNEPDNHAGYGGGQSYIPGDGNAALRTAFDQAVARVCNLGAPIMRSRGVAGGIGTVFMSWRWAYAGASLPAWFADWDWLQYVDPENLGQAIYTLDAYSKYTVASPAVGNRAHYEQLPELLESCFDLARLRGCTRFGLAEYGNSLLRRNHSSAGRVATAAHQQAWITNEIPRLRDIDGLEYAVYFHKPTGTESAENELRDYPGIGTPLATYANLIGG